MGDLLDFLRWHYEGATERRHDLLEAPSLLDALGSTVQLAWPETVIWLARGADRDHPDMLVWRLDGVDGFVDPYVPTRRRAGGRGVTGSIPVTARESEVWHINHATDGSATSRDYLLYRALRAARVDMDAIEEVLGSASVAHAHSDALLAALAGIWLDERLAAGYTPAAAQTMLALVADPRVCARMNWEQARPLGRTGADCFNRAI